MIEDALGLKIYQYKVKDAEHKLERTNENMEGSLFFVARMHRI